MILPNNKVQFVVAAFGMIFDEQGRILLVHRTDYDLWNLPGGALENAESPVDGAKREVKEETGLDVEILKLIGVYTKPEGGEIVFSFTCRVIGGKITVNDEADKIEYFEISKIPKNTVPKQVDRIRDVLLNLSEVIFKTQAGRPAIELVKEGKL